MRRHVIILTVALAVALVGRQASAQQRATGPGASSNQGGFEIGRSAGSGQGEAGNFGVGTAGQVDPNARYMRSNRQGEFVGADSGDTEFVGNTAAGNTQSSTRRNIRRGGGGQVNVNRGGRGRPREEVRVVLQLGFTPPKPATVAPARAPGAVASRLARRMERSSWIQNRSPVEVTIDQGIATLKGVVSTEHDRVLAERLAMLEGGIRKVENRLEVESTSAASGSPPALLEPMPEASDD